MMTQQVHAAACMFIVIHSIMEEGCSSVHTEYDESLLSSDSESEPEVEQPSGGPGPLVPLLERLKTPATSDLARKRTIAMNPPKNLKRSKGAVAAEPVKIHPKTRIRQFPDQHFSVMLGKLFCDACRENLSLKKSVLTQHIKSAKHATGLKNLASKCIRQKNISDMLKDYDKDVHPVGENLPDAVRINRVMVVRSFMKAGIALEKVDCFRGFLEGNAYRLTGSQHLRELIPFIHHQEVTKVKNDINGKCVSVIFDGTTHVCEAMVIVIRFIDDEWCIQQRVARLMLLAKSMVGEEVARQLIVCLSTELGITSNDLIASMHDRASVNNVAVQTLKIVFPLMFDIGCFSHTLDHVGEKLKTPILDKFVSGWINIFSRSPKTKLAWKTRTGLPVPSYSTTRWWSKWEVIKHMHDAFGDVKSFLEDGNLPPSRIQLLEILNDPPSNRKLKMELAITVDAGEPFVKETYHMEGDGPLVFSAYEEISTLRSTTSNPFYPNVRAVADELAGGVASLNNQLINYAKACVKPAYDYFNRKFGEDLEVAVSAFKFARFFSPAKVVELLPTGNDLDKLRIFPFLNSNIIDQLKLELPKYMAAAEDISPTVDTIVWWKRHANDLPHWSKACKMLLLVQPSSAAAERVFSILSSSFTATQRSSLEDYIETSIMIQYNNKEKDRNMYSITHVID